MGDRALIHFHNGEEIGPAIYLHWDGSEVSDLLHKTQEVVTAALETMSGLGGNGDPVAYSTARFLAHACEERPGCLSVGCWNVPSKNYEQLQKEVADPDYSHGNAGVFLVDTRDWSVATSGGYGFGEERRAYVEERVTEEG